MGSHLLDAITRAHKSLDSILIFKCSLLEQAVRMAEVVHIEIVNSCNAYDFLLFKVKDTIKTLFRHYLNLSLRVEAYA